MTLQFTQAGSAWACEFEVTDKINLHIENAEGILLYQRTAAGKFALIKDAPTSTGPVFDYDLKGLVYPKHIQVICSSLPTYAEVVSDGEITEIKSQTKEVEITANGTTQVAPDAGYSYLTGVTVKTNVPQSGGSGGGSSYEYYDVSNVSSKLIFIEMATLVKTSDDITTLGLKLSFNKTIVDVIESISAIAIDKDCKMLLTMDETPEFMTVGEFFAMTQSSTGTNLTPITKEEFYTI